MQGAGHCCTTRSQFFGCSTAGYSQRIGLMAGGKRCGPEVWIQGSLPGRSGHYPERRSRLWRVLFVSVMCSTCSRKIVGHHRETSDELSIIFNHGHRGYEGLKRILDIPAGETGGINTWKLLFAGGLAGTLSWASIYPLGNNPASSQKRTISLLRLYDMAVDKSFVFYVHFRRDQNKTSDTTSSHHHRPQDSSYSIFTDPYCSNQLAVEEPR